MMVKSGAWWIMGLNRIGRSRLWNPNVYIWGCERGCELSNLLGIETLVCGVVEWVHSVVAIR